MNFYVYKDATPNKNNHFELILISSFVRYVYMKIKAPSQGLFIISQTSSLQDHPYPGVLNFQDLRCNKFLSPIVQGRSSLEHRKRRSWLPRKRLHHPIPHSYSVLRLMVIRVPSLHVSRFLYMYLKLPLPSYVYCTVRIIFYCSSYS